MMRVKVQLGSIKSYDSSKLMEPNCGLTSVYHLPSNEHIGKIHPEHGRKGGHKHRSEV